MSPFYFRQATRPIPMTSRLLGLLLVAGSLMLASCSGEPSPTPTPETSCADCSADEFCWTTTGYDDQVSSGCEAWPEECAEEQTCDCENLLPEGNELCRQLGWEQGSCTVEDDRPVFDCISTLG